MNPVLDPQGNWDPPAQAREWFSHVKEGNHGWLVWRNHRQHIKYDNPNYDQAVLYREHDWKPDHEHRPLTVWSIAKVSFEADKALCIALGMIEKSKREWLSLSDKQRQDWMSGGPRGSSPEDIVRSKFYRAVMKNLKPLAL